MAGRGVHRLRMPRSRAAPVVVVLAATRAVALAEVTTSSGHVASVPAAAVFCAAAQYFSEVNVAVPPKPMMSRLERSCAASKRGVLAMRRVSTLLPTLMGLSTKYLRWE